MPAAMLRRVISILATIVTESMSQPTTWQSNSQATDFGYLDTTCAQDAQVSGGGGRLADYVFCGAMFTGIKNPIHLNNFRSIQARPNDIWFATLPPAGGAKEAVKSAIKSLTGAQEVSGHTEFLDWENDPTGSATAGFIQDSAPRMFGTHVSLEWLPTSVLQTPQGQEPCKVVLLVREPKENMVAAASFKNSEVGAFLDMHVAAALGTGRAELGIMSRGFAAFSNGYAAAIGAESYGGPKVFLLSQARMANASTAAAEVAGLAEFLGVSPPSDTIVSNAQASAEAEIGDVNAMSESQRELIDNTFVQPLVDPRVTALYSSTTAAAAPAATASTSSTSAPSATTTPAAAPMATASISSTSASSANKAHCFSLVAAMSHLFLTLLIALEK